MWLSSELGGFDRGQGLVYANGLPTGGLLVPLSRQSEDPPEKPTQ
ncbi:hypothetical protein TIFTF001_055926 [Ficus carica]|uniref:Uncharacterized protein n=1 Tax=Ficus carica TaxID=3494 RepID=A0AA88EBC8_FICCA|nr:hypothetical protein TIFTF001_055926 [Ficus carica]